MIFSRHYGRLLFMVECFVFVMIYCFGAHGLQAIIRKKQEVVALQQSVRVMTEDVQGLQSDLDKWHHNPYYKEKIAREQLQMARKDELLYYI